MAKKKTVLITGATSGIGKACCALFEAKGYDVVGLDIKKAAGIYKLDVGSSSSIKELKKYLEKRKTKIDAIVNSAAIQVEKTLLETEESEWDKVLSTNVKSIFLMTKFLFPLMNKKSSIINISSVHARSTSIGMISYVASKGAVSALTRAMALELAVYGIRVNAVLPGAVETPMLMKGLGRNGKAQVALQKIIDSTPLKKIGEAKEVAELVYFLADEKSSSNITGQEFVCDGGVLAKLATE